MTIAKKALIVGSSLLALAFAANSAFANNHGHHHTKVWENNGPTITVVADPEDFHYMMSLKYILKTPGPATPTHLVVDQDGAQNALLGLQNVGADNKLMLKQLVFRDADGKKLSHCDMMKNADFLSGAAAITINISAEGCSVE